MKQVLLSVTLLFFFAGFTGAQDGKSLFNRNCSVCHTIGGGKKVGPDLKGITKTKNLDWLVKFVKSSKDLIASGDPDANAIFNEFQKIPMPSHSLSTAEIEAILNFVAAGGDTGGKTAAADSVKLPEIFTPDVDIGRNLFTGAQRFENGGAACISCHSVRDDRVIFTGTFAKDLSVSYVSGVVETMLGSMPAMISTYRAHTLTVQEKSHLELYLKTVKENQIYNHPTLFGPMLFLGGALFFIFLLLIINIFWKNTKKTGVKDEIYERQLRTQ